MTPTTSRGESGDLFSRRFGMPVIRANSRQLDDRFAVLGFTVNCAGRRYYEVLLSTEPSLFHPSHVARRTQSNFYSSRQDSGPIRGDSELYIAPAAVLQRFAGAPAIYYTVLAYDTPGMEGATPADDPESLARNAPYVSLSPGFTGRTLSHVLGAAPGDLRRVRHEQGSETVPSAQGLAAASAAEDMGEGEDGYGLSAAWDPHEHRRDTSSEAAAAQSQDEYDDGYGAQDLAPLSTGLEEDRESGYDLSPAARAAEDDLGGDNTSSYGLQSTFPAGAQRPAMLEDEDYVDQSEAPQTKAASDDADYDDGFGAIDGQSYGEGNGAAVATEVALTGEAKRGIMRAVSDNESGNFSNRYEAINPNSGPPIGLVYGIVQFTQASGSLGLLLNAMRLADRSKFDQVFGPTAAQLVSVLTAPLSGATPRDARNARVQPVPPAAGAAPVDIWLSPWRERFIAAAAPDLFGRGTRQTFNHVQDEMAIQLYLDSMLPMARWLGLNEDRMLGVLMDRAVHMGTGGARGWVMRKVLRTGLSDAQVQQALSRLGHADLTAFQRSIPGLRADGQRGPMTEAALLYSLRHMNGSAPFPIPSPEQIRRDVLAGARADYAARTQRIIGSPLLTGVTYSL